MISINDFDNFKNIDYKGFSSLLKSLDPIEFAIVGSLIGILLSLPLTSTEQNAIGNFFILIGQELLTIQSHQTNKKPPYVNIDEYNRFKNELTLKIEKILKNKNNFKN